MLFQSAPDETDIIDGLKDADGEDGSRSRVKEYRPKVYGEIPGNFNRSLFFNLILIVYQKYKNVFFSICSYTQPILIMLTSISRIAI